MKKILTVGLTALAAALVIAGCKDTNVETNETTVTTEYSSEVTETSPADELDETEEKSEIEVSTEAEETVNSETKEETENTTDETEEVNEVASEEVSTEAETEVETTPKTEEEKLPSFTVEDMTATMYAQRAVNVRSGPSTDYEKIGGLNTNDEVKVTGRASTGWYRIEYSGKEGYVSNNYLGESKVEVQVQAPANNTPATNTTTTTPNTSTEGLPYVVHNGYTLYSWRTTSNGVPIYEWKEGHWPQYVLDAVAACCTPEMSDLEKGYAIHDYIVAKVTYSTEQPNWSTKDTLATGYAQCTGYANTFQSMMCAVGIETDVLTGQYGEGGYHAINRCIIDGKYYYVDVTFDDPYSSNWKFTESTTFTVTGTNNVPDAL